LTKIAPRVHAAAAQYRAWWRALAAQSGRGSALRSRRVIRTSP
jgi:hypothetical protein